MKNIIAAFFLLLSFGLNAQVVYEDDKANVSFLNNKYRKHLADNHIVEVKVYTTSNKHPDEVLRNEYKYDSHGNMLENIEYAKYGRVKSAFRYQYNDSNKMTSSVWLKRGKLRWGGVWVYDKWGNNVEARNWWKDTGNITFSYVITYDVKNNPIQTKTYYNKKLNSTSAYEYYDDGSKKKTTSYNRRGKVIGVWNYDCDPIGKLQESKMKDTSKICVHYETDKNGNPIKVKEEYTRGGWLFKHRLRNINKYNKDGHFVEDITMKMNGKETAHYCADYNLQGYQTEWRQYIPNSTVIKKRNVYTYDNSGDIIETTFFSKPSDKGTVCKYVYN